METIKPSKTLVEQTYQILLDAICSGELQPGERLTQDEIAARLNVSRQPVNSAISILKANRFVEDTGRRGVVVSEIDPVQFRSIYEYRAVIEPFTVQLAADRLAENARAEAGEILVRGHKALSDHDPKALLQADVDFHEMLYRWSGNHVIENSMRLNWQHIRRAMAEVLKNPSAAKPTWDDHTAIIDAMFSGATQAATDRMRTHIEAAHQRTIEAAQRRTSQSVG